MADGSMKFVIVVDNKSEGKGRTDVVFVQPYPDASFEVLTVGIEYRGYIGFLIGPRGGRFFNVTTFQTCLQLPHLKG